MIKRAYERISHSITDWLNDIKQVQHDLNKVKAALLQLNAQIPVVQKFTNDLKVQSDKMAFKNKPHLERIQEANDRIKHALHQD